MADYWRYEKLDENGKVKHAPVHDMDGKVTGRIVYNLKAWLDEHPEERKALGWIKHIMPDTKDLPFNRQTQYLRISYRQVDPYTLEDEYEVLDKTEEMLLREEMGDIDINDDGIIFYGGGWYER